jgi:nitrogen fixation NifU-like protein
LKLYADVQGEKLADLAFEGSGCAISVASASLMTESLKGRALSEVREYYDEVHKLLTEHDYVPKRDLGKLAALSGVREFPARVKCASLCWHTLIAALESERQPVSTE